MQKSESALRQEDMVPAQNFHGVRQASRRDARQSLLAGVKRTAVFARSRALHLHIALSEYLFATVPVGGRPTFELLDGGPPPSRSSCCGAGSASLAARRSHQSCARP